MSQSHVLATQHIMKISDVDVDHLPSLTEHVLQSEVPIPWNSHPHSSIYVPFPPRPSDINFSFPASLNKTKIKQ